MAENLLKTLSHTHVDGSGAGGKRGYLLKQLTGPRKCQSPGFPHLPRRKLKGFRHLPSKEEPKSPPCTSTGGDLIWAKYFTTFLIHPILKAFIDPILFLSPLANGMHN